MPHSRLYPASVDMLVGNVVKLFTYPRHTHTHRHTKRKQNYTCMYGYSQPMPASPGLLVMDHPLVTKHGNGQSPMKGCLYRKLTDKRSMFNCQAWLPEGKSYFRFMPKCAFWLSKSHVLEEPIHISTKTFLVKSLNWLQRIVVLTHGHSEILDICVCLYIYIHTILVSTHWIPITWC